MVCDITRPFAAMGELFKCLTFGFHTDV
jgi:hypothetical protein